MNPEFYNEHFSERNALQERILHEKFPDLDASGDTSKIVQEHQEELEGVFKKIADYLEEYPEALDSYREDPDGTTKKIIDAIG